MYMNLWTQTIGQYPQTSPPPQSSQKRHHMGILHCCYVDTAELSLCVVVTIHHI